MISHYQSGKAILSVEKDGDDLYASILSLSGLAKYGESAEEWLYQAVNELAVCNDWLPAQCFRMQHGDKMIFKVNFEQSYYKGDGYTSDDDDEELVFTKAVKLYHRRGVNESRRSRKKYYQTKNR